MVHTFVRGLLKTVTRLHCSAQVGGFNTTRNLLFTFSRLFYINLVTVISYVAVRTEKWMKTIKCLLVEYGISRFSELYLRMSMFIKYNRYTRRISLRLYTVFVNLFVLIKLLPF